MTVKKSVMPGVILSSPAPLLEDNALPNIHPVDELAALREEIAMLTEQADEIRDGLLREGASLTGDTHIARIADNKRETLDRKALIEAFGEEALAPYTKTTTYKTVKITEK
jgi:hypothetical protein